MGDNGNSSEASFRSVDNEAEPMETPSTHILQLASMLNGQCLSQVRLAAISSGFQWDGKTQLHFKERWIKDAGGSEGKLFALILE